MVSVSEQSVSTEQRVTGRRVYRATVKLTERSTSECTCSEPPSGPISWPITDNLRGGPMVECSCGAMWIVQVDADSVTHWSNG